uniref:Ligand dependent nuclear receptor corepressor-like n=1 Tax=Cyprinodon variegatus TaxID=28743 RepID=A0A3Q2C604_CYPVA
MVALQMAAQCAKCLAERKGFRRELDSWRHKLVHCVGNLEFLCLTGCEPKKVDDWSAEASVSHCSFCNLPLDKLSVRIVEMIKCMISSLDTQHNVTLDCDPKIPLVAQELMNKIIHQFAEEYASKCLLPTTTNGITRPSSPLSETSDAPLDLTVNRTSELHSRWCETLLYVLKIKNSYKAKIKNCFCVLKDCVLDLSNRNSASSHKMNEYIERSWELSEGLLSKALKDIRSGRLLEQRAALLYGIPLQTLQQGLENWTDGKLDALHQFKQGERDYMDETTSHGAMSSTLGGEARLVLQKVAAWAERAEIGGGAEENPDSTFPSSTLAFYQPSSDQKAFPQRFLQLRNALLQPTSPSPSLGSPTTLRIPQVRSLSDHNRAVSAETASMADHLRQRTSLTEGTASLSSASPRPLSFFKLRSPLLAQGCSDGASQLPDRLGPRRSSLDETEDGCRDKDKQPRKKRGRYRQYDHELMEEAITMVMAGRMSVSKAQGVYGVPHSTLEYKVKERTGTLKNPPKKKSTTFSSSSNLSASGTMTSSSNSGNLASTADAKGF